MFFLGGFDFCQSQWWFSAWCHFDVVLFLSWCQIDGGFKCGILKKKLNQKTKPPTEKDCSNEFWILWSSGLISIQIGTCCFLIASCPCWCQIDVILWPSYSLPSRCQIDRQSIAKWSQNSAEIQHQQKDHASAATSASSWKKPGNPTRLCSASTAL